MVQEKKLKIIELIGSFTLAGAEIFAADLSKAFLKDGHEVKLISIFQSKDEEKYFERVGKNVRSISSTLAEKEFKSGLSALFQVLKVQKKLASIIEEFHPDVIHTHTTYPDLLGKLLKRKFPSLKVVRTIHTTYDRFGKVRKTLMKLEEKFLPSEDMIVFISERIKHSFIAKYSNAKVIPIALDFSLFEEYKNMSQKECRKILNLPEDGEIFLNIGRLVTDKNQLVLIEAFKEAFVNEKDKHLLIIGDGPLKGILDRRIKELNMEKQIILLGKQTNIAMFLRASDIFILPSLREGTPLTLFEASYMNVPIIASNLPGIKDIVYPGTLFINDPTSQREIKKVLLSHPFSSLRYNEKTINTVAEEYEKLFSM